MSKGLEQGRTSQELLREREQRVTAAIGLHTTDRVPVTCPLGFFVAKYSGIPCSAAYYDWDAWMAAYRKALDEFRPDMAFIQPLEPGKAMECPQQRVDASKHVALLPPGR